MSFTVYLLPFLFIIAAVVCVVLFLVSIPFSLGCGLYLFQLFDQFAGTIPLLLIAIFELIAIAWVYGTRRFACVCVCVRVRVGVCVWVGGWVRACMRVLTMK